MTELLKPPNGLTIMQCRLVYIMHFSPALSKLLDYAVPCHLQPDWWERCQAWEKEARSKPPAPATQAPKPAPAQPSSTQQPQGVMTAITQACAPADCLCAQLTKLCVLHGRSVCQMCSLHPAAGGVTSVTTQTWAATDRLCMVESSKNGLSSLVLAQTPCLPQWAGSQADARAAPRQPSAARG